jgi:hypothetical protein
MRPAICQVDHRYASVVPDGISLQHACAPMTLGVPRWALLVATQHGKAAARGMTAEARAQEVRQLLLRAGAVATPSRIVALIASGFENDWRELAADLPAHNLILCSDPDAPLNEIGRALVAIRAREAVCSVILIPADHCAAVETGWVTSAREALRLASAHLDTVYLLHDKPSTGPLPFDASSDMCSSTVVVGATDCLIELCRGTRPARLIELSSTEAPAGDETRPFGSSADDEFASTIKIVRIRSIEEYASLQRGEYTHQAGRFIDLRT